jgi:hypothetical protein
VPVERNTAMKTIFPRKKWPPPEALQEKALALEISYTLNRPSENVIGKASIVPEPILCNVKMRAAELLVLRRSYDCSVLHPVPRHRLGL